MSAGTNTVTAPTQGVGLEMAFFEAPSGASKKGSDKQYRMFLFGNRVLVEWNRRGSRGLNQVKTFPTVEAAKAWFLAKLAEQEEEGYVQEVSPRVVEIPQAVADLIAAGAAPQERLADALRQSTAVLTS